MAGDDIKMDYKRWPLLTSAVDDGIFLHLDLFFAKTLLKKVEEEEESVAACLCYVFAAAREGHLCICEENEVIFPTLSSVEESSAIWKKLNAAIVEGMRHILPSLVSDDDEDLFTEAPLSKNTHRLYLQKNAYFEKKLCLHLQELLQEAPKTTIEDPLLSPMLNNEQKKAVIAALNSSLLFLTGGPGTGKTFTAVEMIRSFVSYYSKEERKHLRITVTAPTGKAVSHLDKSIRDALGGEIEFKSGTLHALLNLRSSEDFGKEPAMIFSDLLIVDEASMLDARLFSHLLSSVQKETKIVFMGDKDQLPPVDCGSLFADILDFAKEQGTIPYVELKTCLRSDREEILSFAHAINISDEKRIREMLRIEASEPLCKTKIGIDSKFPKIASLSLWNYAKEHFPFPCDTCPSSKEMLLQLDQFKILSCVRKGPFGVDAVNQLFFRGYWTEAAMGQYVISPIIITKNDYGLELFNGEVGVLVQKKKQTGSPYFDKDDTAYFIDRSSHKQTRAILALMLPSFEYAYALSVHKSQGSEYEKILLLVPEGSTSFGKEVLYTAVTRAKKSIAIEGSEEVIVKTMTASSRKISGLHDRLKAKKRLSHEARVAL